jgi:methanogenic corrinoid protein MtbC1
MGSSEARATETAREGADLTQLLTPGRRESVGVRVGGNNVSQELADGGRVGTEQI